MKTPQEKRRITAFLNNEYRKLIGYVRRRVDEIAAQEAEDIVHDVAVQLFNKADVGIPIEHLSAYIYSSLRHRIVDYFRNRTTKGFEQDAYPEIALSDEQDIFVASATDILPGIRQMEIAHELFHWLDKLNEDEKKLIRATDIDGYTMAQLSELWKVPLNTLLSRKARAMKKLQQIWQNQENLYLSKEE